MLSRFPAHKNQGTLSRQCRDRQVRTNFSQACSEPSNHQAQQDPETRWLWQHRGKSPAWPVVLEREGRHLPCLGTLCLAALKVHVPRLRVSQGDGPRPHHLAPTQGRTQELYFPKADILKAFRGHFLLWKLAVEGGVLGNTKSPRYSFLVQWLNYCSEGKRQ